jgi:hypothetical protein
MPVLVSVDELVPGPIVVLVAPEFDSSPELEESVSVTVTAFESEPLSSVSPSPPLQAISISERQEKRAICLISSSALEA